MIIALTIRKKQNRRLCHNHGGASVLLWSRCIPGFSSPVYAVLWAIFILPVFGVGASPQGATPKYYLTANFGYGLDASGSIVDGAGAGLDLIEAGINNGILYSPGYSEIVDRYGPVYQIPGFDLESRLFQIGLSRYTGQISNQLNDAIEYGVMLGYIDILGSANIPVTMLNLSYFDPAGFNGIYVPVTSESKRTVFATDITLQLFALYHTNTQDGFDFFGGVGFGGGRGWLAGFGRGPYLTEAHATLYAGGGFRSNGTLYYVRLNNSWFAVMSPPTSFIDRREVLVNPRKGDIRILNGEFGISVAMY